MEAIKKIGKSLLIGSLAGLAHGIATALGSSKESEWQTTAAL